MRTELLEVRRRLRDDFRFYSKAALKIRDKNSEIVSFKLNYAQEILQDAIDAEIATRGYIRIIILKARQLGLSTHVGGYLYFNVSQSKARKAIVLAHVADSTRALFDMTKRFHDCCPEALKPSTRYSSRRELTFDKLDSSYVVATAGGDSIARGETISHVHASELAFWPPHNAKENLNGLLQAVPATKGTAVFIESTANGVTGPFYENWNNAVQGKNGYRAVFIPWFADPNYRELIDHPLEHTPEEQTLIAQFKLDDEQLMFRRRKIAQNGLDLFKQEYPATPDEAFLTTGRPVFNPEQLTARLAETPDPVATMALEEKGEDKWEWHESPRGELTMYHRHVPGETYVIGADIGAGIRGRDYSVAQVLDSKKRQVAVWRSIVNPDYFARVLYELGTFFNMAMIIPENNNHGILTCTRLGKDYGYPYVYQTTEVNKITERENTTIGFATNVKTKPLIIDELRAVVRDGEIELNDKPTIRELLTYIVTESGSMQAEGSCFDDCVMSLAMANHIHEGAFEPIKAGDEWFIEAI